MIPLGILSLWIASVHWLIHPLAQEALTKVGAPYVAGTLESPKEDFIYRTDAFDCFTLVEHCVAKVLSDRESTPASILLERNRYRQGQRAGYGSRHHYFTSWVTAGVQQGWLVAVRHPSEQPWKKKIDYMSTHRGAYPTYIPLREWTSIQQQENEISQKEFYFFAKETLPQDLSFIQTGDIIAFTSTVAGLDVNHEGIAYWKQNQLHFIHASQEIKKVVVSDETLIDYVRRIKKHAGIMIYRLNV